MADHTITIQSKGLGDPIRTSQNEGKSGEKIIVEEIKKLLTQMRTDRPETTYAEAQKRYWEETQATRHARNMGQPMLEGGTDDGYSLAGEYKLAGESQSEPRPQSDQDIAALGFLKEAQEAAAKEAEVAALMKEAAQLLLKFQEGGIESLTEEEAGTLDKAHESANFLDAVMFGGENASKGSSYLEDWKAKQPVKVEDPDTESLREKDDFEDQDEAIEDAINIAPPSPPSPPEDDDDDDDDFISDIRDDVASGTHPAVAVGKKAVSAVASFAVNAPIQAASTGSTFAGQTAGVAAGAIGGQNASTQMQAVGSAATAASGAVAGLGKVIKPLAPVFEALDAAVGMTVGAFTGLFNAMEAASEEVMAFNPNIMLERLSSDLNVLQKQMQRAQLVGDELAEFEGARGEFVSVMEDIKTVLIKVFGPLITKIVKIVTALLQEFLTFMPGILKWLSQVVESLSAAIALIPGVGGAVTDVLDKVSKRLNKMSKDAAATLEELKKTNRENVDLSFSNWLLGANSEPPAALGNVLRDNNAGVIEVR